MSGCVQKTFYRHPRSVTTNSEAIITN